MGTAMSWPILVLVTLLQGGTPSDADERSFRGSVAPILESRCVRCHGGIATKGGLSLATAEALRKGGDSGPAIEAGKPDESLLLEKIGGETPEMPKGSAPLSAREIEAIRTWIADGASWPSGLVLHEPSRPWWAIQPVVRPGLPAVRHASWCRTPIDQFILARLELEHLVPQPAADRRTLIRRVTYDLLGLPPEPEDVDAFVADHSPDAFERVVERLLASPHYGERWARHWLDVVHYGDTHGYDKDKRRDHAWPYRDYVIGAMNADRPYDAFVCEQVAGDVMSPADPGATVATGFIAAGPWDFVGHVELREDTVEKAKTRLIDRDDMLANTMSTFVSLTVHCARCHDHKFDPITQQDYYGLQAVFAGVDRGDRRFASPELARRRGALETERAAVLARYSPIVRKIEAATSPELTRLDHQLAEARRDLAELPRSAAALASPTNGYHSAIHAERDATAWVQVDLGRSMPIDEIRLVPARPTDFPDTPGFGFPARYRVMLADVAGDWRDVWSDDRADDLNHLDEPEVIRLEAMSGRYIRVAASRLWKRSADFVFALAEVEVLSGGTNVASGATVAALDSIEAGRWSMSALVDGFDSRARRPAVTDENEVRRCGLLARIGLTERARSRVREALIDPELRGARDAAAAELAALDARLNAQPAADVVFAVQSHAPRPIHVLRRGDVEQPGAVARPGALACVDGIQAVFAGTADEGARRAALAAWLVDARNPLTWRSIVNRTWHYHFGRGLVDTPNDFGRNGSAPSHPELLDWLASEFRDTGRSLKALHRQIVTSAAYRQASTDDPAGDRVDGDNRLLWRMNRRRLDAESIRDAILAVNGQLDRRLGGPGFELFRFKDDHSPVYDHDAPEKIDPPEARRRTVYRFVVRSVPNPLVECLDGADPNVNVPVRNSTITALQALALLNDPFVVRQAEALAARLEAGSVDPARQVESAFRLAFGRPPRTDERAALLEYTMRHGTVNMCRLIFNMNEFVFVD
jgi:hypothetical protein